MKEDDAIRKKLGTENPFRVPDGYLENLTSEVMNHLPAKERPAVTQPKAPTTWERIKPWMYMAAMFVGAALIIRVASSNQVPGHTSLSAEETEREEEYINMAMENSMMDDYSLYVYLTGAETE